MNQALEVVQAYAKPLGVLVSSLTEENDPPPKARKPGPVSPLERRFQEVKRLPKKSRSSFCRFLDTVLESSQQKQKA